MSGFRTKVIFGIKMESKFVKKCLMDETMVRVVGGGWQEHIAPRWLDGLAARAFLGGSQRN